MVMTSYVETRSEGEIGVLCPCRKATFSGSPSGPRRVSVVRSSRESDQGTDRRQHQRSGELEQATEGSIKRPEITSKAEFENDDGDIIGKRRIPETHFPNARHPLSGKTRPAAVAVDRVPRVPAVRSEQQAEGGEHHHDEDPEQDDVHKHMLEPVRLAGKSRWTPL